MRGVLAAWRWWLPPLVVIGALAALSLAAVRDARESPIVYETVPAP